MQNWQARRSAARSSLDCVLNARKRECERGCCIRLAVVISGTSACHFATATQTLVALFIAPCEIRCLSMGGPQKPYTNQHQILHINNLPDQMAYCEIISPKFGF